MVQFELEILNFIHKFLSSGIGNTIWVGITKLGDAGFIWGLFTIALLIYPKTRRIGVICGISLVLSFILTNVVLKNLVERVRPFTYGDIKLLISAPTDYSFPSGHTSASFAFAFVLLKEKFKLRKINLYVPAIILACLVAFSRLYLYVHFPTDIIGGILVGFICSIIARKIYIVIFRKNG